MDKAYSPHHEQNIYDLWQKAEVFNPDSHSEVNNASPFSIIMPPPNANDPLHVGHAMFVSIEDILIRYHRMKGDDTVWIPGTDHAGIETQFVFEKKLTKQGKSRFDFDRTTLYQMIWEYVQENSGTAVSQMKRLGASADWSRFKFTLDPDIVSQVLATFVKMHQEKLIYRDLQLVNYCTKCGTSYSELEVDHEERGSKLYYLKYGPFVLATTRPETKFADTAVAVHPDDPRYQQFIGQEIEVEGLIGSFKIKLIADEYVDPEFGTGVVKITPYHDFNDFQVWQRHKHEMPAPKQVVGYDGRLTKIAGKYAGMKVKPAREQIEKDLQEKGLLEKIDENYLHSISICYKCASIIEPLPLPQFFVKVKDNQNNLVAKVLEVLDQGKTKIHGPGRDKILRHWLENLHDWNISRQIVWGIRIPVWYSMQDNPDLVVAFLDEDGRLIRGQIQDVAKQFDLSEIKAGLQTLLAPEGAKYQVSLESPGEEYLQETDTFDTWFSSSQWPVVTLTGDDFNRFYPTSVMETAYDILLFWVMRMMLMGVYLTGETPFRDVYLHGLVRDEKGQKMSKSKGNVINPISLVEKYGADAVRMALVVSSTPGNDSAVGENKVRGMRNFSNKIWNASRFVMMLVEDEVTTENNNRESGVDQQFSAHLEQVKSIVAQQLEDLKIGLAAETVHNEFWHWFCDVCIEEAKAGKLSKDSLVEGLLTFLKLLHPFAPFVTESVWQELQKSDSPLLSAVKSEPLLAGSRF